MLDFQQYKLYQSYFEYTHPYITNFTINFDIAESVYNTGRQKQVENTYYEDTRFSLCYY